MNLPPFKLERYFARYEFAARHLLCSSDCETVTVGELLDLEPGARERFEQLRLGYTETPGAPTLRQAITPLYTTIRPDQVLVHAGAQEAILLAMQATLQPRDHVVAQTPCYQSLAEVARTLGCEVSLWPARRADDGWHFDLEWLRDHLRPTTRLVVINTPHNPTGWLMPRGEFTAMIDLLKQHNILLFCDEVYRELEFNPGERLPAACDAYANAISLGVMSKTYGLAGLRIGWVATHRADILQRMAALKDYTTICSSGPSEFLAEVGLRHRDRLAARNLGIIRDNLALLDAFFRRHGDRFTWIRPRAGPIAYPRWLGGDVGRFCQRAVEEAGVMLLPGTVYDDTTPHFRIGFGRKTMPEALIALERWLDSSS